MIDDDLVDLYGDDDDYEVDISIEVDNEDSDDGEEQESEEEVEEPVQVEDPTRSKHCKKILVYQRKVHDIDSSLCEDNYTILELITKLKFIKNEVKVDKKKGTWSFQNKKPTVLGHQTSNNVIKNKPGLTNYSKNVKTELDAFESFFTQKVMENLVKNTNDRIKNTLEKFANLKNESDKYTYLCETSTEEM